MSQTLSDNGNKRSGIDRRKFSFDFHLPDRRSENVGKLKPRILE